MKDRKYWFSLIVAAQAVFLLGWAGWHEQVRTRAPVIRLKTVPVDPQDLLRGDYMILRYEISAATPPPATAGAPRQSQDFWVVLAPEEGVHRVVRTSWEEPVVALPQVAVKASPHPRGAAYGIETYFVPEGKGTPRFNSIVVEAAVSPTHRLYIKRVLVDGTSYP